MKVRRSISRFALLGVATLVTASAGAIVTACKKAPSTLSSGDSGAIAPLRRARTLVGMWRPTALVAVVPGTEASVRMMNAQFSAPDAKAARIEYTADRVISTAPGIAQHSAPYSIVLDLDDRVVIHDYRDDVTIFFADDDHATIDRKNNPYGARMKIERVKGDAPSTP
jgi:hypothetical protein